MENEKSENEITKEQKTDISSGGTETDEAQQGGSDDNAQAGSGDGVIRTDAATSDVIEAAAEAAKKTKGSEAFAWIRDIIIAIVIALIISQFITPTIVQEHSMDDTLHNNDYLILWKMAYRSSEPSYGDIVVFKSDLLDDKGKEKLLIKRVVARSGDTIAVKDGYVYRNGKQLMEPYTKDGYTNGGIDETVVPDGKLFLLGDNRVVSIDSRDPSVGFVDEDLVIGKAVLRLYPFNKMGGLYSNYTEEEKYEAGIVLTGTEIKSIRQGRINLKESYAKVEHGEVFVYSMNISPYDHGNIYNVDPMRPRKLLLNRREIRKIDAALAQQGLTLIPLSLYLNEKGMAKLEIGIARGKKLYDKRESIAKRDAARNIDRMMKTRNR